MLQHTSRSRSRSKLLWGILPLMAVLALALAGCGGSSNPSTTTVYIDEHAGELNSQDAPLLDKFWFSNSKTDQTFTTSYSINLAPEGMVTLINESDDPQQVTITGPNNYSSTHTLTAGPDTSISIQLPAMVGNYSFITDPVGSPQRDGARGGIAHVA